jgi:soluble calcium-activated nucleotidase 1
MDGDGDSAKGFKCEWGTVKDNLLYIGSFGKEYTNDKGVKINWNVKLIFRKF